MHLPHWPPDGGDPPLVDELLDPEDALLLLELLEFNDELELIELLDDELMLDELLDELLELLLEEEPSDGK